MTKDQCFPGVGQKHSVLWQFNDVIEELIFLYIKFKI